ncbi:MAG: M23 family metallopeptidase [Lutibacter sp.]|uniref:M23 family metallopeptidase n=1 Tax=Lutibacter sp. TaxID=1925666 RepID=UPI0017BC4BDE|nr:M23 family metallopeptidase [Lutibacter sp.]MBT8316629.1 M23 family metallopeptidase [Lutibacter sp.]NNJ57489.1 M23 family metallopeptidase [Lutibacter sp.]
MRKIVYILVVFYHFAAYAQGDISVRPTYPSSYFDNPLDIPLVLSGTFGELRSDHFHAGLDLKTQQKEGLNVIAAAAGYISRIKISHWGYGKAIYITHPSGFTTVYAHLQKFNKRIESYIKKQQYKKESFEIQVFPSSKALPIKKNEIIALSGSTGGFVGPHLHFEIRDTKTEKPINPMLFGIQVSDGKKPRINTLIGYPLDKNSQINSIGIPSQISLINSKNGELQAKKIYAFGKIGFGINAFDQLDGAYNKNGLYSLTMLVNGLKVHEFNATTFSFSESKYINLLIDYERFKKLKQRIQKCFIEPSNKLSLYSKSLNKGFLNIEDGLNYKVEIIAKDFKGNQQKVTIPIVGKKDTILVSNNPKITQFKIDKTLFNKFQQNGVTVAFPKYTFYNNFYLDFEVKDALVKVHTPTIPLDKRYTLTFDVSGYSAEEKKQLYIAYILDNGKSSYENTVKKDFTFYTSTKKLGDFTLLSDTINPKVRLQNFKDQQWLTHFKTLKLKISDNESGIKSYRGEIDGEWILLEYNVKNGILTYDFNDKIFTSAKHTLKVIVEDNVGNLSTLNATFFRKK